MIKVYGCSDDLVEVEGARYPYDEIGCFDKNVRLWFADGTIILVSYPKENMAVWKIEVEKKGMAPQEFIECNDPDAEIYSDIFRIAAVLQSCEVVDK